MVKAKVTYFDLGINEPLIAPNPFDPNKMTRWYALQFFSCCVIMFFRRNWYADANKDIESDNKANPLWAVAVGEERKLVYNAKGNIMVSRLFKMASNSTLSRVSLSHT